MVKNGVWQQSCDEICTIPVLLCLINAFISDYPAECDKLRKDGFRSSQYYSQGPTFSDPAQSVSSLHEDEDDEIDKKVRRTKFTVRVQDYHDGQSQ